MSLNCLLCDCLLEDVMTDGYNHPQAGTTFFSSGNYGSTVWDPMSPHVWLEINICDECMKKKADEGVILVVSAVRKTNYMARPWNGSTDDGEAEKEE